MHYLRACSILVATALVTPVEAREQAAIGQAWTPGQLARWVRAGAASGDGLAEGPIMKASFVGSLTTWHKGSRLQVRGQRTDDRIHLDLERLPGDLVRMKTTVGLVVTVETGRIRRAAIDGDRARLTVEFSGDDRYRAAVGELDRRPAPFIGRNAFLTRPLIVDARRLLDLTIHADGHLGLRGNDWMRTRKVDASERLWLRNTLKTTLRGELVSTVP